MLADRGMVERRGQTMQVAAGADIPIPETVQAVIAARLDTLPAERKALLHDAAVVGTVFWVGALAFMSGLDERAVEARPADGRPKGAPASRPELVGQG